MSAVLAGGEGLGSWDACVMFRGLAITGSLVC